MATPERPAAAPKGMMDAKDLLERPAPKDLLALLEQEDASESPRGGDVSSDDEDRFAYEARRAAGTPAQLRAKIRKFLATTNVKVTEFQRMLSVNSNSYNRFMNQKYKDPFSAMDNSTYDAAAHFFLKEKKLGQNALGKKRSTVTKDGKGKPALPDISECIVDGMTYLTPGEVRKEIQALLKKYRGSAAALARLAEVPYQSFNLFLKAGGEWGAKDNQAYHPAAALVEKFRVATGAPKSRKRKGIESEVAAGKPVFLGADPDGTTLCPPGVRPILVKDGLGRNVIKYQRV